MTPMAQQILDFVADYENVSFAELSNRIEGFNGNLEMLLTGTKHSNIVLWTRMSQDAVDALGYLFEERLVEAKPASSLLVYLCDGMMLKYPIAKRARHYKEPHWLPAILNPTKAGEQAAEDRAA